MSTHTILNILRRHRDRYISGEDISVKLGVSRAAVWKEMRQLRNLGYHIEAQPHLGYQLTEIPDKLFADEIAFDLKTEVIGRKIYSYESLDSTNDVVYKFGEQNLQEGICVFTEYQKKGRGRLGRRWVSPKGNSVLVSVLLRPKISLSQVSGMTLMVAVSAVKAIKRVTGVTVGIKWPNDLVYEEKKIGGVLTELSAEADRVNFVVVGMGVNVNADSRDLPKGSVSLKDIAGRQLSRIVFAQCVLEELDNDYLRFKEKGFEELESEWERYSATTGRRVEVTLNERKIHGQAAGIDRDGALWIRKDSGLQQRITAGDIQHLR